jgi:DNA topoisomerase I
VLAQDKMMTKTEANNNLVCAIEQVASQLGNTRSVCRKANIHPNKIKLYHAGLFITTFAECEKKQRCKYRLPYFSPSETTVLAVLEQGELSKLIKNNDKAAKTG